MTGMEDTPPDLTIQILRQIRDEIVTTRTTLSDRIDHLTSRVDHMEVELSGRIDHLDVAITDLAQQQRFIVGNLRGLGERDMRLVDEVDELRGRVEALEKRTPG